MSDKHPVLTVYDPEGKYTSLLPLAENKGITVINTTKTPFAAYEQAFDCYLNKLGIDREARMLIYRSKHIPATEGEKSDDPFYALSQIGECFPFGPNDDLLMISKRFLPNKTAEIDKLQAEGNLKFNSINALQGGASYPVLENLTHGKSPKEMTLGLLRLESVADLSWMQEWKQLAENHYSGLNADGNSLVSVQENLWQYLLFSEFVLDLPTKLPDTMASIPMALPENKETIFDLCNSIRNLLDMREDYVRQAKRISDKLHLADSFAKATNLGAVVTFAFENKVEYTCFNQAVSSGQYEQAAAMVAKNKQSIWYETDDSVRQFWNLADHACQLFAVIYASKSIPADASFKDIAQWYASTGYKADNAFRHYMTIEQDISHVSPYINDLSKAVVDAYRSFTETEVQQYQQTVVSEGLQGEIGIQRNTNAFNTHIAHLTLVSLDGADSCRTGRQRYPHQHIGGIFIVPVKGKTQTVMEQRPVESDICLSRGFPGEIGVTERTLAVSRHRMLVTGLPPVLPVDTVSLQVSVIAYTCLVTGLSPTTTNLEIIDPVDIFHERLTGDTPSSTNGREETPAVLRSQFTGAIGTEVRRDDIPAIVVITETSEG